jgi:RecA-family ATPase
MHAQTNTEEVKGVQPVVELVEKITESLIDTNIKNTALIDYKVISLQELMETEFDPIQWVVERLIPASGLIALSGAPASYKTWLILDMAQKIASGTPLFNRFETKQTGVLLVDEENGNRLLQMRFKKIGDKFDLPIYTLSFKDFKLTSDNVKKIIRVAKKKDIGLIIFDSLVRIHEEDENSATAMASVFSQLRKITNADITVLFTHHHRKKGNNQSGGSQEMRGSSDILASLDCHLSVDSEKGESSVKVTQNKSRYAEEIGSFTLNVIKNGESLSFEIDGDIEEEQSNKSIIEEAIVHALTLNTELCKADIFRKLKQDGIKVGNTTFLNTIKRMVKKGAIQEKQGEKNTTLCSLVKHEETRPEESVKNTNTI